MEHQCHFAIVNSKTAAPTACVSCIGIQERNDWNMNNATLEESIAQHFAYTYVALSCLNLSSSVSLSWWFWVKQTRSLKR